MRLWVSAAKKCEEFQPRGLSGSHDGDLEVAQCYDHRDPLRSRHQASEEHKQRIEDQTCS